MRAIAAICASLLVAPALGFGAAAGETAGETIGEAPSALIDGRVIDAHPVSAVGALLATADDGHSTEGAFMCSAVLVTPTVALTAAHCVALVEADAAEEGWRLDWWLSFEGDVRGFGGPDPILPRGAVAVHPIVHHGFDASRPIRSDRPDAAHDIAALLLAEPAPVAPVPMARISDDAIDGVIDDAIRIPSDDAILLAGYGLTAFDPDAVPGERLAGPGRVFAAGANELRVGRAVDADGAPGGLAEKCGGDSGGPTFARTADGWRVIGLTSRAHASDPGCAVAGFDTRVDVYAGWVDAVAADAVAADDVPMACAATPGRGPDGGGAAVVALLMLGLLGYWARRRAPAGEFTDRRPYRPLAGRSA